MNLYHTPMIPGPFDDSARARQIRMGLLDTAGKPNLESVAVLARVYAGLMFDDLCETSPSIEEVNAICDRLETLRKEGDARKALLYICVQYDGMLRALPEPVDRRQRRPRSALCRELRQAHERMQKRGEVNMMLKVCRPPPNLARTAKAGISPNQYKE